VAEAFQLHDNHTQPIAAALAQALCPRAELTVEVTFDTAVQDPAVFLYADLVNAAGDLRAHVSIRLQDKIIVLNTQEGGVWGPGIAVDVDFDLMRHWRLWLVLSPDGVFCVKLGTVRLCEYVSQLRPQDVTGTVSNVSMRCVLGAQDLGTGLDGVFDRASGSALIYLRRLQDYDPESLGFSIAGGRVDILGMASLSIAGQVWLRYRLAGGALEGGALACGIRVTAAENDGAGNEGSGHEFVIFDVLAHPVVEISHSDIVLRAMAPVPVADVFWRSLSGDGLGGDGRGGAGVGGDVQTATRLVTSGPGIAGAQGVGFARFITPLSEFLRLVPPSADPGTDPASSGPITLGLFAAGLPGGLYALAVGPGIYGALEALARAAVTGGSADTVEWRMVFMDWWSVLHAPDHMAGLAQAAPFLSDILIKQRQFAGAGLKDQDPVAVQAEAGPKGAAEGPSSELIAFWRALRSVGALLAGPDVSAEALRRHVMDLSGLLRPDERHYFILELSGLLLDYGLGDLVNSEIPDAFVVDLMGQDRSSWQLSAALAPLAARKRFDDCCAVLNRLTKLRDAGFNYGAISASVLAVSTSKVAHEFKFKAAYGFLEFLKSLSSREYTAFRHAGLMRALIRMTLAAAEEPDWFQADLLAFIATHYATVPEFWTAFETERSTAASSSLLLDRFAEIARTATQNNARLAAFRALAPTPSADKAEVVRIVAGGERRDHLSTFLRVHGLADPASGGALTTQALCEDHFLRSSAHPFPPATASADLPLLALRDAVQRLQSFPLVEHRTLLETIGRALFAGDLDRVSAFIPLCVDGGPTGDPSTNAVILDAITWALLTGKRDEVQLSAIIVRILTAVRNEADPLKIPAALHTATRRLLQAARGGDLDALAVRQILALEETYRARFPQALAPVTLAPVTLAPVTLPDPLRRQDQPAGFFSDTLIALITCRKYLDTRAQECRETWVKDVEAAGARVLFFCGSDDPHGAATLDAATGVVTLPVGDAYEDLPAKVLAIFRWIRANRPEAYVLKIDDDCYLDAQTFLTSLSYRRSHYFGRPLTAFPATFDRVWHQAKSARPGNKRAIDTSPLGTRYADGGGSYVLSRFALDQLDSVADSGLGVRLRLASYFEDKMIGDLLQAGGVTVSDIGYTSMQARRTHGSAVPVLQIDRTFMPSAISGIAVAHLDTTGLMAQIRANRGARRLDPPRIWPMNVKPSLAYDSNMLELLNPQGARQKIEAAEFVCVCALRNEMTILPHFLAHYRALGVQVFLIADNLSDDGTREYLRDQPDVVLFSAANDYKVSHYGVDWQRVLLDHFCAGRWVVVADADEFLLTPQNAPGALPALCRSLEAAGHDAALAMMADMYPEGALDEADFARRDPATAARCYDRVPVRRWIFNQGPFGNLGSYVSGLRHRLMPLSPPERFTAQKVALFRFNPLMSFSEGFHFGAGLRFAPQALAFLHYKYSAAFAAKARLEALRGQHFGGGVEYRAYLDLVEQGLTSLWRAGISETLDLASPGALDRLLAGVEPPFRV
jgi:hypothetical protein